MFISHIVRILDHSTSYEWGGYRLDELFRYFSLILQHADPGRKLFRPDITPTLLRQRRPALAI